MVAHARASSLFPIMALVRFLTVSLINRFDIEGYVTGFGNLDWARTHESAARTAPIILALVDGGATCIGKTIIDELAYG